MAQCVFSQLIATFNAPLQVTTSQKFPLRHYMHRITVLSDTYGRYLRVTDRRTRTDEQNC